MEEWQEESRKKSQSFDMWKKGLDENKQNGKWQHK